MRVIAILSLLIFLVSCNKNSGEDKYIFKGIIIDYSTNTRIANANVSLIRFTPLPGGERGNPVYDYGVTNANGEFSIEADWLSDKPFYIIESSRPGYRHANYLCISNPFSKPLKSDTYFYRDTLFMDKQTIVAILINNTIPANLTDTLVVSLTHSMPCPNTTFADGNTKQRTFTGFVSGQILADTFSLKSGPIVKVSWKLMNNGIISSHEQTINPTEFGNTTFNLDY